MKLLRERRFRSWRLTTLVLVLLLAGWAWLNIASFDLAEDAGECGLEETGHANRLEALYPWLVRQRFSSSAEKAVPITVVTIAPDVEPLSVVSNVCEGRAFMANLLRTLSEAGAAVIAIDKFYSDGACPKSNPANDELSEVAHTLKPGVPLIVGQATHEDAAGQHKDGDCLVQTSPFRFGEDKGEAFETSQRPVIYGLTRLNENTLQIPLAWPVRKAERALKAEPKQGFALLVAEQAASRIEPRVRLNSDLERLAQEESQKHHPFAEIEPVPNEVSAMDLLCSEPGKTLTHSGYEWKCPKQLLEPKIPLKGRIVVVGERVSTDMQPVPGRKMPGVELQAAYIVALLQRHYLTELDYRLDWGLTGFFVLLFAAADLLVGSLLTPLFSSRLKEDRQREVVVIVAGVFVVVLLCVLNGVLLLGRYYAPICLLAVYPLGLYVVFRAIWLGVTWLRDAQFVSEETR